MPMDCEAPLLLLGVVEVCEEDGLSASEVSDASPADVVGAAGTVLYGGSLSGMTGNGANVLTVHRYQQSQWRRR